VNSRKLLLLGGASLLACSAETFSARDDASGGAAASAGASTVSSGGSDAASRGGAGGSAQSGSASLVTGGTGAGQSTGGTGNASNAGALNGGSTTGGAGGVPEAGSAGTAGAPRGGKGGSDGQGGSAGTPEIVGGCGHQLLHNGNFDIGPSAEWEESSDWSPGLDVIVSRDSAALTAEMVAPDTGDYLAWLGGLPDNQFDHHVVMLTQSVVIPEEAGTLTLTGKVWVRTEEEDLDADEAYLEFSIDDDVVWQAKRFSNLDAEDDSDWTAFSASTSALATLRGRTLTFVAYARTDPTLKTSFWLDSLRLEAACDR